MRLAVIAGGPVLFLVGRAGLEQAVFSRVSRDRVTGLLVLAALVPAMLFVPPLAVAAMAGAVLGAIATFDTVSGIRHPEGLPAPEARASP